MDKSYLLHNMKVYDDPDGKVSLDVGLKFIDNDPDDVKADVTLIKHEIIDLGGGVIQETVDNVTYPNISLIGSGGGGSNSYKVVSISTINNSGTGKTVTCPRFYLNTPHLSGGTVQIPTGNFQFYTIVPLADGDGYTTITFSAAPTDYSDGIQQSGPGFHITEDASEETITWG